MVDVRQLSLQKQAPSWATTAHDEYDSQQTTQLQSNTDAYNVDSVASPENTQKGEILNVAGCSSIDLIVHSQGFLIA